MKINIFYLLSKISLILLSLIAIFAIFSSFQDNISINLLYVTVAIIHAGLILQIKKLNRPIRFLFVIVVTPLLSYLLLNYVSGVRMLELRGNKKWGHLDSYKEYKASTPKLIPKI